MLVFFLLNFVSLTFLGNWHFIRIAQGAEKVVIVEVATQFKARGSDQALLSLLLFSHHRPFALHHCHFIYITNKKTQMC